MQARRPIGAALVLHGDSALTFLSSQTSNNAPSAPKRHARCSAEIRNARGVGLLLRRRSWARRAFKFGGERPDSPPTAHKSFSGNSTSGSRPLEVGEERVGSGANRNWLGTGVQRTGETGDRRRGLGDLHATRALRGKGRAVREETNEAGKIRRASRT